MHSDAISLPKRERFKAAGRTSMPLKKTLLSSLVEILDMKPAPAAWRMCRETGVVGVPNDAVVQTSAGFARRPASASRTQGRRHLDGTEPLSSSVFSWARYRDKVIGTLASVLSHKPNLNLRAKTRGLDMPPDGQNPRSCLVRVLHAAP